MNYRNKILFILIGLAFLVFGNTVQAQEVHTQEEWRGILGAGVRANHFAEADFDKDGDIDVFASMSGFNRLYINNGTDNFSVATGTGLDLVKSISKMAVWGDYDNDGRKDLFVVNLGGTNELYHANNSGSFTRIMEEPWLSEKKLSRRAMWNDIDADGDLDLKVEFYNSVQQIYKNYGQGKFRKYTEPPPAVVDLRLNEINGARIFIDSSGLNNNATCGTIVSSTCPLAGLTGVNGTALKFNGLKDMLLVPDSVYTDITEQITLEAWVKPEVNNHYTSGMQAVVSKGTSYELDLYNSGTLRGGITNKTGQRIIVNSTVGAVKMYEWNHVVMTYDGQMIKLYVNGVKVGEKAQTGLIGLNNYAVTIGNLRKDLAIYYQGLIDNVKVYKIALTEAEALTSYQEYPPPVAVLPNHLLFKLDESVSSTAFFDINYNQKASCVSCPLAGLTGVNGTALKFNGLKDMLLVPDSVYTDITEQITLEAWVKPEVNNHYTSGMQAVVSKGTSYELDLYNSGTLRGGITNKTGQRIIVNSTVGAVKMFEWNHVVMTYDGQIIRLYVNGIKVGEKAQIGLIGLNNYAVTFGNLRKDLSIFYQGLMDQVKIYKTALSPVEILSGYQEFTKL